MSNPINKTKLAMTTQDAVKALKSGNLVVIDVRETAEIQATGTAQGGIHIPLGLLPLRADPRAPDFDRRFDGSLPIAVFCAVGGRAGRAADFLNNLGVEAHSIGGFADWVAAGGPVSR